MQPVLVGMNKHFEVNPDFMAAFLRNNNDLFPQGTVINDLQMNIVGNTIQLTGDFVINRWAYQSLLN